MRRFSASLARETTHPGNVGKMLKADLGATLAIAIGVYALVTPVLELFKKWLAAKDYRKNIVNVTLVKDDTMVTLELVRGKRLSADDLKKITSLVSPASKTDA